MKGIVAEIRGNQAAILLEDGRFLRTRNAGYAPGQRVVLRRQAPRALMAIAAALVVTLGLSGAGWAMLTPYATVSIDVNPSVTLTLNRFFRVLSVEAADDDGAALAAAAGLPGLYLAPVETAVEATVSAILDGGAPYADDTGETYLVIAASATDGRRGDALAQSVTQAAEGVYAGGARAEGTGPEGGGLTVIGFTATADEVQAAREKGTTPGKLHIVATLADAMDDGEALDEAYWLQRPVREIVHARDARLAGTPEDGGGAVDLTDARLPEDAPVPPEVRVADGGSLPPDDNGEPPVLLVAAGVDTLPAREGRPEDGMAGVGAVMAAGGNAGGDAAGAGGTGASAGGGASTGTAATTGTTGIATTPGAATQATAEAPPPQDIPTDANPLPQDEPTQPPDPSATPEAGPTRQPGAAASTPITQATPPASLPSKGLPTTTDTQPLPDIPAAPQQQTAPHPRGQQAPPDTP